MTRQKRCFSKLQFSKKRSRLPQEDVYGARKKSFLEVPIIIFGQMIAKSRDNPVVELLEIVLFVVAA